MLGLLVATGTLDKLLWVVGALVLVIIGGAATSLMRKHDKGGRGHDFRQDIDRGFRKPPDEGGLL
jgi:hypothetical protein